MINESSTIRSVQEDNIHAIIKYSVRNKVVSCEWFGHDKLQNNTKTSDDDDDDDKKIEERRKIVIIYVLQILVTRH